MPEPGYHYFDCTDIDCPGCLPTDNEVRAASLGKTRMDATRRGLNVTRAREAEELILADADDYRARSTAHRKELFPDV